METEAGKISYVNIYYDHNKNLLVFVPTPLYEQVGQDMGAIPWRAIGTCDGGYGPLRDPIVGQQLRQSSRYGGMQAEVFYYNFPPTFAQVFFLREMFCGAGLCLELGAQ